MTIDSTDQKIASANRLQDRVISTVANEVLRDGVARIARQGLALCDDDDPGILLPEQH